MKIDWQDIESAPKDRPIMAYVPDGMWSVGNPYLMVEWCETEWLTLDDICAVIPMNKPQEDLS